MGESDGSSQIHVTLVHFEIVGILVLLGNMTSLAATTLIPNTYHDQMRSIPVQLISSHTLWSLNFLFFSFYLFLFIVKTTLTPQIL